LFQLWDSEQAMSAVRFVSELPQSLRIPEASLTLGTEIGSGASAVVYKALLEDRPVCVKVRPLRTIAVMRGGELDLAVSL
jgi:hypothetical protein